MIRPMLPLYQLPYAAAFRYVTHTPFMRAYFARWLMLIAIDYAIDTPLLLFIRRLYFDYAANHAAAD